MFATIPKVVTANREVNQAQDHILGRINPLLRALPTQLVPSGAVMLFAGASAPNGYLLANGALVSRASYPTLYAALGDAYGAGDGATTFQLPTVSAYGGLAWVIKV